jgi:ABC-type transport system involved in multi-copper enzyme maturation permease subunit
VYFAYLSGFTLLIVPAFVCGLFTGEHENRTAVLLQSTPLRPRHIILGKWIAGARLVLVLLGLLIAPTVPAVLYARGEYLATPLTDLGAAVLVCLAWAVALVSISLAWSLVSARTTAALVGANVTAALLFGGPLLAHQVIRSFTSLPETWSAAALFASPLTHILSLLPPESIEARVFVPGYPWFAWIVYCAAALAVSALLVLAMASSFRRFWIR